MPAPLGLYMPPHNMMLVESSANLYLFLQGPHLVLLLKAYRLRLDVLLRVRGQRRAMEQIERALAARQQRRQNTCMAWLAAVCSSLLQVEFISNRPSQGPIFTRELLRRCRDRSCILSLGAAGFGSCNGLPASA